MLEKVLNETWEICSVIEVVKLWIDLTESHDESDVLKELTEAYQKYCQSDDDADFESFIRVCGKTLM